MEFLNFNLVRANETTNCDASNVLFKIWPAKKRFQEHELTCKQICSIFYMLNNRAGKIITNEVYLEYLFINEGQEMIFNAHPEIDIICRVHNIYPAWLEIPVIDEIKLSYTLKMTKIKLT